MKALKSVCLIAEPAVYHLKKAFRWSGIANVRRPLSWVAFETNIIWKPDFKTAISRDFRAFSVL
jgi:hypothetical protein